MNDEPWREKIEIKRDASAGEIMRRAEGARGNGVRDVIAKIEKGEGDFRGFLARVEVHRWRGGQRRMQPWANGRDRRGGGR